MAPAELGTVIVTGGSSGLGDAVAHAVHDAGGVPVVLDLAAAGQRLRRARVVDLADTRASEAAVDAVAARARRPRGVVTAAGIDACGRLDDVDARRVGARHRRQPARHRGRRARRAAAPRAQRGPRRHRRLDARPQGGERRHRLLRDQVRRGRLHPRARGGDGGPRRASPCSSPAGCSTRFFDGRPEQYKPGADARLADPSEIAQAVVFALSRPAGVELRELVMAVDTEPSWP